jgi:aspartyl-tRNA(Asn)/glutamyl-tRNA(Gln) amidotransferase subunit C
MSEEITPELFQHLVELAALELEPEEGEYLRREMNNQLKAIHELASIPLETGVPTASHGIPYTVAISANFRLDEWRTSSEAEKLLAQAPEMEDGYIIVPEIPHKDLE